MNTLNVGLEGRYKFIKHKADAEGNVIPGTAKTALEWFDNLITNAGLDLLGSTAGDNLTYCRIGTGNTDPTFADTSLVAQVGSTNTAGNGGANGLSVDSTYLYRRVSRRFAAGTVAGVNLAEVGMAMTASGSNIFSRALLRDTGGTPTTITLAADEVLDVVYELRMYLPAQDLPVAATIDGVASTVTIRYNTTAAVINLWAASLGREFNTTNAGSTRLYGVPLETLLAANVSWNAVPNERYIATLAYVPGSYTKQAKVDLPLVAGNFATGVGSVIVGAGDNTHSSDQSSRAWGTWAWGFSPKLNKTASRTATITVGVTWGRHTP